MRNLVDLFDTCCAIMEEKQPITKLFKLIVAVDKNSQTQTLTLSENNSWIGIFIK